MLVSYFFSMSVKKKNVRLQGWLFPFKPLAAQRFTARQQQIHDGNSADFGIFWVILSRTLRSVNLRKTQEWMDWVFRYICFPMNAASHSITKKNNSITCFFFYRYPVFLDTSLTLYRYFPRLQFRILKLSWVCSLFMVKTLCRSLTKLVRTLM